MTLLSARRVGRSGAGIAFVVLALGLVGVALAGGLRNEVVAKVTVTVTDSRLVASHSHLQAGQTTFVMANKGRKPHVLAFSGPGVKAITRKVPAGKSATVSVMLRTGAYRLADVAPRGLSYAHWFVVGPASKSSGSDRTVQPFPDPVPMECD
jgi:hypothetical protein